MLATIKRIIMNISFLLGAGFSAPDKYPTRKEINERLKKISHEEIMIHTDGTALFLNGQKDPNVNWTNIKEKLFVEKFLEFYNNEILNNDETFDYEIFYDFYQGLHFGKSENIKFDSFAEKFKKEYDYPIDNQNLLGHFHNTFNQLLASMLIRWPERVHLAKFYTKYPAFLTFIEESRDKYEHFYFHTLNHDLLLEELSYSDAMQGELSDGFEELGSPFYSKNNDGLTVRLRRFTNKFDTKFCLYKLHGSIDQYVYNFQNKEYWAVKVPFGVSSNDLMKEYKNDAGILRYDKCWWNYYPDFLSGTTEKINSYSENHYYKPIFDHFINNLKNSSVLISIGYGLGDSKINEFIINNFLSDESKILLIINPHKPNSVLFSFPNVKYYGENRGVQHIDLNEIEKILKI